jgi:hypothetical protein
MSAARHLLLNEGIIEVGPVTVAMGVARVGLIAGSLLVVATRVVEVVNAATDVGDIAVLVAGPFAAA